MIWAIMAVLSQKPKGFWNMCVLVEPRRSIVSLATLVHLTLWSAAYAIITVLICILAAVVAMKLLGADPSPLIGTPRETITVITQMIGLSVEASWFAAANALSPAPAEGSPQRQPLISVHPLKSVSRVIS